jgi:DNA-binding SARP family transcriptional activator/energy-coupling factor transporter ATP-binding protein EcfA2
MAIRLLGPLVVGDGLARLGSRDRIVVSALAMRPGEVLSAEQLADAVWGDDPPASWHKNLQSCMVRLRKLVGPDAIETSALGYRLALDPGEVDGHEFSRLVARARELEALNEPERAAYTLQQALDLWRGRPLAELEEWSPGLVEAQRLQELHLEAEELWLDTRLRAGGHREVLAVAEAMVTSAPLRERRWALLALAQYQSGRQTEALGTLRRVRTMLVQEMGLDPAPELDLLERAILRQDPALLVEATRTHLSDACPYPGLTPYDVEDAEGFFGRDTDIAACLERLDQEGVLVVVGPSGCGKSSLVRAGVTAALRRAGARTVVINPGPHPLEALGAVAQGRPPDVLVIDQAEEVFSLCHDAAEREAFLAAVGRHAEAGRLVLAHRADRMGDISAHPVLARLAERGLYVLAAMPADDLRAAVEGPARQAGLILEPGLVDLLVREIEGESGALPLLSHALRETWQRREGRTLTVSGYRESGGIRGAVAQSAEDLYGGIDPSRRPALRDLLLRLVLPNSEGEPVRARVPRRLLVTDSVQDELIDLLVRSRLLTSDDKAVELAHEALARAWPRLRGWLDDDVEGQRILHHLSSAADAWDSLGRPTSELYRGLRLVQATEHPSPPGADHHRAGLPRRESASGPGEEAGRRRARPDPGPAHPSTSRRAGRCRRAARRCSRGRGTRRPPERPSRAECRHRACGGDRRGRRSSGCARAVDR